MPLLLFEKIYGEVAIAFAKKRTLGIRNEYSFRGHVPTAHTLVCLRFADLVTETVARLATGPGGLTPGRAGFPPAGRRTKFHGVIASSNPNRPAEPGRTQSPILFYQYFKSSNQLQKGKPMNARAEIDPGICKFYTVVTAESEDNRHVTFEFESQCETIKELAMQINEISPVDAIRTLGPEENPMLSRARHLLQKKGCCDACIVPAGAVKVMQIVTNLALPKDVSLSITKE